MLDDEVREILRELVEAVGAQSAAVIYKEPANRPSRHSFPLGHGEFLCIDFGPHTPSPVEPEDPDHLDMMATIERSRRALRACARRWGADEVPTIGWGDELTPKEERIRSRIKAFLQGLANAQNTTNVIVTLGSQVVTSSHPISELHSERIPFAIRRVDAEAGRQKTSHAEVVGDEHYAVSFWFSAYLLMFFSGPYAVDFVRHRVRQVTRELAELLAMLEQPPPSSASVAPVPE